ncbi:hypothetical protein DIT71_09220 [Marinobacter vulgaris]|uniref:Polysaccharide pyruvyl transferase domain-containing protein n=1 Tax=Marinobacter vulgaris TaxID=1928331 RepID=A0A2V3ZMU7_9GAMM|nr:polysaccharide pyruvyl transferase family protein [Marinobacter vulgaris]PXX90717.1 hypothetical protein DIT71_09220 [Marinobacter vulgaris]TSJ70311.1 hypothetical protein FPC41_11280 [Marinobacter vulgaris]
MYRKKLSGFIEQLYYLVSICWGYFLKNNDRKTHAIILPPAGSGSLGDQAMVNALTSNLIENGFQSLQVVRFSEHDNWGRAEIFFDKELTWPRRNIFTWMTFARNLSKSSHFITVGADILDGKYGAIKPRRMLKLNSLARKLGLDARICGFSFNENPNQSIIDGFVKMDKSVLCFLRDPISSSRFEKLTHRKAEECADLAFLLQPTRTAITDKVSKWILNEREAGRTVMAVNLNYLPFSFCENSDLEEFVILDKISLNINELLKNFEDLSIVFVPHDYRGKNSDLWFASEIYSRLSPHLINRSFLLQDTIDASEIKSIAGMVDCAVTGRMHFLIALLGQKTPAISLTYQGKFDGLYKYFDLEGLTMDIRKSLEPDYFLESVNNLLEHRLFYKEKIQSHLPNVLNLSSSQLPNTIN